MCGPNSVEAPRIAGGVLLDRGDVLGVLVGIRPSASDRTPVADSAASVDSRSRRPAIVVSSPGIPRTATVPAQQLDREDRGTAGGCSIPGITTTGLADDPPLPRRPARTRCVDTHHRVRPTRIASVSTDSASVRFDTAIPSCRPMSALERCPPSSRRRTRRRVPLARRDLPRRRSRPARSLRGCAGSRRSGDFLGGGVEQTLRGLELLAVVLSTCSRSWTPSGMSPSSTLPETSPQLELANAATNVSRLAGSVPIAASNSALAKPLLSPEISVFFCP